MPDFLLLLLEFLKTGLFAIGGGYATLPYLHDMAVRYDWFTLQDLSNLIAVSEVTPGPVGINMATFAGYLSCGVIGGVLASLALVTIPVILVLILCKTVPDLTANKTMKKIYYTLIPCATALILAASLSLFRSALLSFDSLKLTAAGFILFFGLLFLSFKKDIQPLYLLLIGGIYGIILL